MMQPRSELLLATAFVLLVLVLGSYSAPPLRPLSASTPAEPVGSPVESVRAIPAGAASLCWGLPCSESSGISEQARSGRPADPAAVGWTNLTSVLSPTPGPLYVTAMAYDSLDEETLLYGGAVGDYGQGSTWAYYSGSWWNLTGGLATSPGPLGAASMAYDAPDGYTILFGGAPCGNCVPRNDTWGFRDGAWTNLTATAGHAPPAVYGAAMADDPSEGVLLFGGYNGQNAVYNDTWLFSEGTWHNLTTSHSPPARIYGDMVWDGSRGENLLTVGATGGTVHTDTWTFTGTAWVNITGTVGTAPTTDFGNMAYDTATGDSYLVGEDHDFSVTYQLNHTGWSNQTSAAQPPSLVLPGLDYDPGLSSLILYGGEKAFSGTSEYASDQTWTYGGPVPLATVTISTTPTSCGSISFGGVSYTNGQSVSTTVGPHRPVTATTCAGYSLAKLSGSGGLSYFSGNQTAVVGGSGGLSAVFVLTASLPLVTAYTSPTTCGSVTVAGVTWTDGQSWSSAYGSASVSATPCASYSLSSISASGGVTYWPGNQTASVRGTGSLTATFALTASLSTVTFTTVPGSCGSIDFAGTSYTNGESVQASFGSHGASSSPCAGWVFASMVGSGAVSYWGANGTASVGGAGGLTATFVISTASLPLETAYTSPSTCGSITVAGTPWTNGQSWNSPFGSQTVAATACAGYTLSSITGAGGVTYWPANDTASVGAAGSLTATFAKSTVSGPTVSFATSPGSCGSISFSGTSYSNGGSVTTTYGSHPVSATPAGCPSGTTLTSLAATGALTYWAANGTVSVGGAGTLTATFQTPAGSATVFAYTSPTTCGSITLTGGIPWTNGQSWTQTLGTFGVTVAACSGYKLSTLTVSGKLTYWSSNMSVSVGGPGDINATFVSSSTSGSSTSSGFLGLPGSDGYLLIAAVVAIAAVAGVVVLLRRRKAVAAPPSEAPAAAPTPPPPPPE